MLNKVLLTHEMTKMQDILITMTENELVKDVIKS